MTMRGEGGESRSRYENPSGVSPCRFESGRPHQLTSRVIAVGLAFAQIGFYRSAMNIPRLPVPAIVVLAASIGLGACASSEGVSMSRPGKYNLYNCTQLNERGVALVKREQELQGLMQKAAQGPGGEVAIALAYRSEYNITQGDLREIDMVGAKKQCVLKHRSVSDQVVR